MRDIEDRLEIYNLIASHPPRADTGADYYTRVVYTEDGVFDRSEGLDSAVGNEAIGAFTLSPEHQRAIHGALAPSACHEILRRYRPARAKITAAPVFLRIRSLAAQSVHRLFRHEEGTLPAAS